MYKKIADTMRFLSADMIEEANSGHPGVALGLADILAVLMNTIKHNPKNPTWLNRDRLIFSGGHASSLLYSYLYLSGYDLTLEDLKNFRQLHSKTPGHPEISTSGVEIATGPLGQGLANAVGFAMASSYLARKLNSEDNKIIDHKIYCLCGDGDLQEGISYEASSLAGRFELNNLVLIYDSNDISIEGNVNLTFDEDIKTRFEAQGFEVAKINGHNYDEIEFALKEAKNKEKPYLIIAKTKIAKGACSLEGSEKAHGSPLGKELLKEAKELCNFPQEKFFVADDVLFETRAALEKGDLEEALWRKKVELLSAEKKAYLKEFLEPDFSKIIYPEFKEAIATRDSNGKILQSLSQALPSFIGGSADLGSSNKTLIKEEKDFPFGRNLHYGVREQAMAAINNAFARSGFLPYCATFLVFSDYMKAGLRLSALMKLKAFFIFTHDSIGVGEDGPTHEPIEQLSTLRMLPNLYTFRPADGRENVQAWKKALEKNTSSAFILSRQKLQALPAPLFGDVENGAYLLQEDEEATLTLLASGSEVGLCLEAGKILQAQGIKANIVSAPCFELFNEEKEEYKARILNKKTKILAVEAAKSYEWYKYADEVYKMETFGESGKAEALFEYFGFTAENISQVAKKLLEK